MTPPSEIMTTHGLAAGYLPDKLIADRLDLSLSRGDMTLLLGANGRGKSTLLRTLSGAQPALAGEVSIAGKSLADTTAADMARLISLVYTDRTHAGHLTAAELVALGRQPYTGFFGRLSADDRRIVDESLDTVGMLQFSRRYVSTLSDGERQKIMLARALAQQTPVILLDEPTSFLDIASRIETMQMLHDLAADHGKAILLSTHDIAEALPLATHAWLLVENDSSNYDSTQAVSAMITGTVPGLVATGAFDRLFPRRPVVFDPATMTFQSVNR
ncbi:MAG TPA: ABC transporter ATP-binding protein [Porphyromonadaceae bacterium]|nr:ABC transporter ATP-binding protein [Porphyromonadaceae bacterium]